MLPFHTAHFLVMLAPAFAAGMALGSGSTFFGLAIGAPWIFNAIRRFRRGGGVFALLFELGAVAFFTVLMYAEAG